MLCRLDLQHRALVSDDPHPPPGRQIGTGDAPDGIPERHPSVAVGDRLIEHRLLPDEALGTALKGKYRGQRQRWFAFLFTGNETEIDVVTPGGGKFHAEFDKWRWEELTKTPDLIVEFKRAAYREVVKAFADVPPELRNA